MICKNVQISHIRKQSVNTIVAYTGDPWDSAVPMIRILAAAARAGVTVIRGNEGLQIVPERVRLGDLVIIQRDFPRYADACAEILSQARGQDKPVIYDIDDLFFELPEGHVDRVSHHYTDALLPMLRMILQADAITVSTRPLCAYLSTFISNNIWVQPNYLDETLWPLQYPHRQENAFPVTIGYMGSATHHKDLELVAPVLREIAHRYGDRVRLVFYGGEPPASLLELPQTDWVPFAAQKYHDFVKFFSTQSCSIFIAPLINNIFNQCKSAIKFLEYSAQGVPGVYSDVAPYASVITDGEDAILCDSDEAWGAALTRLIEDPELRWTVGLRAQETLRQEWILGKKATAWKAVYEDILCRQSASHGDSSSLALTNLASRLQREIDSLETERLETRVTELETRITELVKDQERTMDALKETLSWRLMEVLWRIEKWIVPSGSQWVNVVPPKN